MIDVDNLVHNFAETLRLERLKRRLSQERLAELAELHRTTISAIEREKLSPTIETAAKLANALKVRLQELLKLDE